MPRGEEILQQDRRSTRVQIRRAAVRGLGGGEALVVQLERKTERGARVCEPPHALRLRSVLATQRQRETDDQSTYLLFRDQLTEAREVGLEIASRQRAQRPREAERIVTDGEPDTSVADVQRKITHAQGEADVADVAVSTLIRRRESKNGSRGHHPGHTSIRTRARPCTFTTLSASVNSRPASDARSGATC